MAYEELKRSTLLGSASAVLADLSDLVQKEMNLARAEISEKLSTKLRGSVWMLAAGLLGLVTFFLMMQALVFAIASYGVSLHWACLILALATGGAGALAFFRGRTDVQEDLLPRRTFKQVKQDIATTKERLT